MSKKLVCTPNIYKAGEWQQPFSHWIRDQLHSHDDRGIESKIDRIVDFVGKFTELLCDKGVVSHEDAAKLLQWNVPKIIDNPDE